MKNFKSFISEAQKTAVRLRRTFQQFMGYR